MKYLKRFNEELSPEFLNKYAATAVSKGGYHETDRAPALRNYANEVAIKIEKKEDEDDLAYWRKKIQKCNKNEVIKLKLETGLSNANHYIGEFYPLVDIGVDMLDDRFNSSFVWSEEENKYIFQDGDYWFNIFVYAIVSTEEGLSEMTDAIYEYEKTNSNRGSRYKVSKYREGGIIRMAFADMLITLEDGTFRLGEFEFYAHDDVPCDVHILDRHSSGLIRTAILKELNSDEIIELRSTIRSVPIKSEKENNKKKKEVLPKFDVKTYYGVKDAIEGMFAKYGIGSKYGISYQDIYDKIKLTPGNKYTI